MNRISEALARRVNAIIDSRLATKQDVIARAVLDQVKSSYLLEPRVYGPSERLQIAHTAKVNDAIFNTVSGEIEVGDYVFFGHGVAVLTGTHDTNATGPGRQSAIPSEGRNIVICAGAWVSSRAMILGPCRIGVDAVVAAGAVVTSDVLPGDVVAGVPAKHVRSISTTH